AGLGAVGALPAAGRLLGARGSPDPAHRHGDLPSPPAGPGSSRGGEGGGADSPS
ncbi:hypothetical protein NDU88_000907, partial [Pleurodeles waltl]